MKTNEPTPMGFWKVDYVDGPTEEEKKFGIGPPTNSFKDRNDGR